MALMKEDAIMQMEQAKAISKFVSVAALSVALLIAVVAMVFRGDRPEPVSQDFQALYGRMVTELAETQQQVEQLKDAQSKDRLAVANRLVHVKKEIDDLTKNVLVFKRLMIEKKGKTLNADQDIQKMVEEALHEEPVRAIKTDVELVERARAIGLKTVVLK